jgi:hypothetical protein
MSLFEDEISADSQMREYELLARSPAVSILSGDVADLIIKIGKVVPGFVGGLAKTQEIINKFFQLGAASPSGNLNHLAVATRLQIVRAQTRLALLEVDLKEIDRRTSGPELQKGIAAATLQSLRTTQEARFKTMALLLGNGLVADDLEPENLDHMIRAAAELNDFDLLLLRDISEGTYLFPPMSSNLFVFWQDYWATFGERYAGKLAPSTRGAFGRLESFGFIYGAQATSMAASPVSVLHVITDEGKLFHQRIQEIKLD